MRIPIFCLVGLAVTLWRCQPDPHSPKGQLTSDTLVSFVYDLDTHRLLLDLPLATHIGRSMADLPRSFTYRSRLPDDWEAQFYSQFLALDSDTTAVSALLSAFRRMADTIPASTPLDHAVAFVQDAIAYTDTTAYSVQAGLHYPYETLLLGHGVCSDKSVLLAKLLIAMDYDVAFVVFPTINHMGLGIKVPAAFGDFGTTYAYIETTLLAPIGYIPDDLRRKLGDDVPHILLPLINGRQPLSQMEAYQSQLDRWTTIYGTAYLTADAERRRLIRQIEWLRFQVEALQREVERLDCEGLVPADRFAHCSALIERQRPIVARYNELVLRYNAKQ